MTQTHQTDAETELLLTSALELLEQTPEMRQDTVAALESTLS